MPEPDMTTYRFAVWGTKMVTYSFDAETEEEWELDGISDIELEATFDGGE